jgi:putative glutamine amidotransferase
VTLPRIGLTTYARGEDQWFRLPAQYVDAVRRAGGLPVLLPPGEPRLDLWLEIVDGLILTGGGDVHPSRYGGAEHPSIYNTDPDRDRDELELARHLVRSGLPGLCICRGLQVLNVALGGTLIAHLPDAVGDAVAHRTEDRKPIPHAVTIGGGSRLADVLGATDIAPASLHHQAIAELGEDLEVVARAPDGTIEAVEVRGAPSLLAVQWHPELTAAEDAVQQRLFDEVVRMARAAKRRRS